MKASTLFALTIAILIGLGAAVAVKVSGILDRPQPEPAPVIAKAPPVKVLAAAHTHFAGNMIPPNGVYVRDLKPEEAKHYQENKEAYLTPIPTAVFLRKAKSNLVADQPILKSDLEKLAKPASLPERLMPEMRAISISVSKDKSAGGLIQLGEWVDVMVTSKIVDAKGGESTQTVTLAPRVRIIAKRNSLWPTFANLPEEKPIQFTLEVNPYRAALIEYIKTKGEISITPLPSVEQARLEAERKLILEHPKQIQRFHFIQVGTPEARKEDEYISRYKSGATISETDLIDLFGLTTATTPPPEARIIVEQMAGLHSYMPAVFDIKSNKRLDPRSNSNVSPQPVSGLTSAGLRFIPPTETCQKVST